MFTPRERDDLRESLVAEARDDPSATGLALTGSASVGREDQWSDVDLAVCTAPGTDPDDVAEAWTRRMYAEHGAADISTSAAARSSNRVFLLVTTLQVALSFWPAGEFGATAPTFRLMFGEAVDRPHTPPPDPAELVGTAWLYAVHVRSGLRRGRVWSAHWSIAGMRDAVLSPACLRHGTNPVQARGVDDLPAGTLAELARAVPHALDADELHSAFRAATDALLTETRHVDPARATRLAPLLHELAA